ncbi:MAG: PilZ domain-containing protein [Desulfobacula sp.]|jgi:hypothetical protein
MVPHKEKRMHYRIDYITYVELNSNGELLKETSKNLSVSGIYLKSSRSDRYNIGDVIIITFIDLESQPRKYSGLVVRKTDKGIGIKFISMYDTGFKRNLLYVGN